MASPATSPSSLNEESQAPSTTRATSSSHDRVGWQLFAANWTEATGKPLGALARSVWSTFTNAQLASLVRTPTESLPRKVRELTFTQLLLAFELSENESAPSSTPDSGYDTGEDCEPIVMQRTVGQTAAHKRYKSTSARQASAKRGGASKKRRTMAGTAEDPIVL